MGRSKSRTTPYDTAKAIKKVMTSSVKNINSKLLVRISVLIYDDGSRVNAMNFKLRHDQDFGLG